MPNFMSIGQTVAEIWRLSNFKEGDRPPFLIFKSSNLTADGVSQSVSLRNQVKFHDNWLNRRRDYGDFSIFFMRWTSAILDSLYVCLGHPPRVVCGHYRCSKFGWNWYCSFKICELQFYASLA